jgi:hypothetical protein
LNDDGTDVDSIGNVKWDIMSLEARLFYLEQRRIKYGRARKKDELTGVLIAHIKAAPYKAAISNSRRSSEATSGATTKGNGTVKRNLKEPDFLTKDGTIYRMINVISVQKVCYIATKNALTRDELDSGLHHVVEWTTLTASYNNKSESSGQ